MTDSPDAVGARHAPLHVEPDALGMPTFMQALSWVLLTVTSLLVLVLGTRTVRAMIRGEVCVPE